MTHKKTLEQSKMDDVYEPLSFPYLTVQNPQGEGLIPVPNLVAIHSIGDGSCFFHSILRAFSKRYIESDFIGRRHFAMRVREYLAEALAETNPATRRTYYADLARGNLADLGRQYSPASLTHLQGLLRSSNPVSYEFNEAISNFFNLDIFILFKNTSDVYILESDPGLLYKHRMAIFLLYSQGNGDGGHYETVGIRNPDGTVSTFFEPEHYLPRAYRHRYDEILHLSIHNPST